MDVFQWDTSFETGLSEVDQQHHHLVDITNKFGCLLSQDEVRPDDIEDLFNELVSYTKYHFDEEEKVMHAAGVDKRHATQHEKEHEGFFQDVTMLHKSMSLKEPDTGKNLYEFLINWLVYHILGSDMNLAKQIEEINNGSTAAEAFAAKEQHADKSTESLLKALNNLFHQVSSRNRQLMELNQSLESKVEKRTQDLLSTNQKLEELATTDVLTGLANRRFAIQTLDHLWEETNQKGTSLSCILIDADNFKEINDTYGHDAGDIVLRTLAKNLKYAVRTDDIVCRLGGDEFLIICPNTNEEGSMHIANMTHAKISDLTVEVAGGAWQGSISVGVAIKTDSMQTIGDLIKAADRGVYAAKEAGKNCVMVA